MRRSALLIGSQTYGLSGVGNDVDTMADLLDRRGFTVTRRECAQATRAEILDAYERLIRDTRADDAVVLYYSGHGGLAVAPPDLARASRTSGATRSAGVGRGAPPKLQFIVPTDYAESTESDFRGITGAELSVLLVRLANVTNNITVVVDACHAAHVSRDDELVVKALRGRTYIDIEEHLSRLRRQGLDTAVRDVLGNQRAVRVVACGRDQSAYEHTNAASRRTGVFTEALARTLTETGEQPATWAGLLSRVRERVWDAVPWQRPEAEGPAHRLLFQTVADQPSPVEDRSPLGAAVTVEWGRVHDGRPAPLPAAGATLADDDHVYVRVRNTGHATVHVSVLAFDAQSRISVVTSLDPSGVPVGPAEEHLVGRDELDGRLVGFRLARLPRLPRLPRPSGVDDGDTHRDASPEAAMVVLVASAPATPVKAYRELGAGHHGSVRHDVHRISFRWAPVRQ
ncbi:caspase family protein [Solwaraspora sp. WMMD406]|uniref:caspase family protein n=1 Tax=Solwaraspora sp. WMMD406 TaxID=3016095 RepID=UPI0024176358|nr:caspase family protein [Solwaraspora sp. WMMD406]MDG4766816.1 caspase family protein [Solwaraspora sp. WMMD406]